MKTRQKKEWQTFLDWNVPKPAEIQEVHKLGNERLNLPAEGAVSVGREMAQVANLDPPSHSPGQQPGKVAKPQQGGKDQQLGKNPPAISPNSILLQMALLKSCRWAAGISWEEETVGINPWRRKGFPLERR